MQFINWLKKQGLSAGAYLLVIVIVINTGILLRLNGKMKAIEREAIEADNVVSRTKTFIRDAAALDLAVRDYIFLHDQLKLTQYETLLRDLKTNYDSLIYHLKEQPSENLLVDYLTSEVRPAIKSHQAMLSAIQLGDSAQIKAQFKLLII